MTIPNRIALDDLPTMPVGEIAAPPGYQLALLKHDADERLRAAKTLCDWLDGAITLKYGDQAQEARRTEGKDTGTVRLQDGPVTVVVEPPKRVEWDQPMLVVRRARHAHAGAPRLSRQEPLRPAGNPAAPVVEVPGRHAPIRLI